MFVVLLALVGLYLFYHLYYKRLGLPPGPTPLPILGNLLTIMLEPPGEKAFLRWKRAYGDVFTFWNGQTPTVYVTGYDALVNCFKTQGHATAGRWRIDDFYKVVAGGDYGLFYTEGEKWEEQRDFMLRAFRDFGVGKSIIQDRIIDEIKIMYEELDESIESGETEQNLFHKLEVAVGSIINALLLGYRYHGDKRSEYFVIKKLLDDYLHALFHPFTITSMQNFNFYSRIPGFNKPIKIVEENAVKMFNHIESYIQKHKLEFDEEAVPTDLVHAFYKEWSQKEKAGEPHHFSEQQLVTICFEVWFAGHETTSITLSWGFAFLIYNPEVQRKCHEELDHVIGSTDRMITLADKNLLPYCNATINEMQRCGNIAPQITWHRTTEDIELNGYLIKKDTLIVPQTGVIFVDDQIYENPEKFQPERFLNEDGSLKRADEFLPFGIGKRICPGEGLARMELFLIFCNILNRYRISAGKKMPSLERKIGATILIDPYLCKMERR